MTSIGFCSTAEVITLDQNWHHVYLSSAGGKDPSNDTQIRVINLMEPETWGEEGGRGLTYDKGRGCLSEILNYTPN